MTDTVLFDDAERLNRIRLIRTENVGPMTFRQLIARFRTATAALEALPTLAKRGGRGRRLVVPPLSAAEQELEALDRLGGQAIFMGETAYPSLLEKIDDAPPFLSLLGHPTILNKPIVGIVGSRNASTQGKRLARDFAHALGRAGFIIASGLANGIDAAAHTGALETGTIASVAGGIDVIYPRENTNLYHDIATQGAVVAEQPVGTVGKARHFPRRNRIISGLSRGVLVVEATQRSGSLITARLAAEQGREVFAIPGSPLDPRARGGNDLIRKGAALVESPDELLQLISDLPEPYLSEPDQTSFKFAPPKDPRDEILIGAHDAILLALTPTPVLLDDLIVDLQLSPNVASIAILELELAGKIERHAGNRISRLYDSDS